MGKAVGGLTGGKGGGGSAAAAPTTVVNVPDTRSSDEYLAILKTVMDEAAAAQAANQKSMNPEQAAGLLEQGTIVDALRGV